MEKYFFYKSEAAFRIQADNNILSMDTKLWLFDNLEILIGYMGQEEWTFLAQPYTPRNGITASLRLQNSG